MVGRALILVFLCLATGAGAAEISLFDLTGKWRGIGLIQVDLDRPARGGRCRMTAEPLVVGREFRLTGRCATHQGSTALIMHFNLHDDETIAGTVASPSLPETARYLGRIEGDIVSLVSHDKVDIGSIRGISRFLISNIDTEHFDLIEWFYPDGGGDAVALVRMNFRREEDGN